MKLQLSAPGLLFPLPILLAIVVFWPALTGPFLFDDLTHIAKLAGEDGTTDTLAEVSHLIFPKHPGTGRSLSYLSLLINDNTWPTEPGSFKYTNLLLHCLNGVLVFALARLLSQIISVPGSPRENADWIALIAMALWLVHPIHLSPMMIVIQRMTLLAGTFSLLALLAYVHGRRVGATNATRGYAWMVPVFGLCLLLGVMSKDTAAMTICFVIAMEVTILGPSTLPRPRGWRIWAGVFLVLPLIVIALYLLLIGQTIAESYANRDFTLGERLLTEARVLVQYLRVIVLPSLSQTGPFQDDFVVSRGFLEPPTTLAALVAISSLLSLAWWRRRRWPVFALAVLWFFLGHSLEGTVIPLELYFEHRNYLPMFGIFFAIGYGLMTLDEGARRLAWAALALFLAMQSGISYLSAGVWGRADLIAVVWGAEHPGSPRAQALTLRYWGEQGDNVQLSKHLDRAIAASPDYAGYRLYRLVLDRCGSGETTPFGGSMQDLERTIPGARYDVMSTEVLKWLASAEGAALCRFSKVEADRIFELYLSNPRFTRSQEVHHQLYILYAGYHRRNGDIASWNAALDRALAVVPVYELALRLAYFHIYEGNFERAETYLHKAAAAPLRSLYDWLWRDPQVRHVRGLLVAERHRKPSVASAAGTAEPMDAPAAHVPEPGQPPRPTERSRDDQ